MRDIIWNYRYNYSLLLTIKNYMVLSTACMYCSISCFDDILLFDGC